MWTRQRIAVCSNLRLAAVALLTARAAPIKLLLATCCRLLQIREELIDGVYCRLYQPADLKHEQQKPAVVYMHGGGLFLCNSKQFDMLLVYFAYEIQGVVISIE